MGAARADPGGARRRRLAPVARATGLGAASSSCSYAAIAIAKSLFPRAPPPPRALAFQFASTNLVWELGLVLWVLLGWQFTLGEYLGGIVMIGLMWALLRLFVSRERLEARGAAGTRRAAPTPGTSTTRRATRGHVARALGSLDAWTDVARNFRGDWLMLWKEITLGFLLAGFIALLGVDFFNGLFLEDAPAAVRGLDRLDRPRDRGAQLRLLDRQRAARRRPVVGRDPASPA